MVFALLVACLFLAVGFVLRVGLGPLRALFIPASVVGGLVGLVAVQAVLRTGPAEFSVVSNRVVFDAAAEPSAVQAFTADVTNVLVGFPGTLIAVLFAGLLLERSGSSFGKAVRQAARQGIVVWIIVFGQAIVGLLAMGLVIYPLGYTDLPESFGQLIETGFAGGHGTAGAMGTVFAETLDFPPGLSLGFFFATFGLVWGVISGVVLVNLGVRRGWVTLNSPAGENDMKRAAAAAEAGEPHPRGGATSMPIISGLEERHGTTPIAFARVRGEVIEPLVFQLLILAAAFGVGLGLQAIYEAVAAQLIPERYIRFAGNLPLFLFTLLGGWIVREAMHLVGYGDLIDGDSVRRFIGVSMEFLIVAALIALRIETIAAYAVPVAVLLLVGTGWCVFCLLVVGRLLLPRAYWFQLGLINYGMSTATTAQGMMLLRIVDRDLKSNAAEDYAVAAPMSAPFVGGGIITVMLMPLALETLGLWAVVATGLVVLAGLFAAGWWLRDR